LSAYPCHGPCGILASVAIYVKISAGLTATIAVVDLFSRISCEGKRTARRVLQQLQGGF
jgi:hypothetical protein